MDQLVEQGYKYLVARVPNYIRTDEYSDFAVDLSNIAYSGATSNVMFITGLSNTGDVEYDRTSAIVKADEYFGNGLSFNSLNPFSVASAIIKPLDVDVASKSSPKIKYNLVYLWQAIDMTYAVNELDCKAVALSTIGFSGDFYYNTPSYNAGLTSTFSAEAPMNITYYYM
jgi:hypothetical protein